MPKANTPHIINRAVDIRPPLGRSIALFTHGAVFVRNPDGTGYTGNWRATRDGLEKVVIYYRPNEMMNGAEIHIGDFVSYDPPIDNNPNHHLIRFANLVHSGNTDLNFNEFTGSGARSLCYLPRG